ncbi:hypothetical protein C8Q78DRAFT_345494 [Trametes maxima]|nr:hypothetical protein C8Q78DRAFT_345494 [Trametes maxima]
MTNISRTILNTQLFLPDPMRLNTYNWEVYKIAIHALCHANHLQEHLERHAHADGPCAHEDDLRKWDEDDQLCKALIVLNIQPELLGRACKIREAYHSKDRGAAYLWELVNGCEGYFSGPACKKRREAC